MSQLAQVKAVELVRPDGAPTNAAIGPAQVAPVPASNWWIAVVVGFVLLGNAMLVWRRIRGRDPLRCAFRSAAREAGLDRKERSLLEELAGETNPPVTLLISDAALERSAAGLPRGSKDVAVLVGIRQKLSRVQG